VLHTVAYHIIMLHSSLTAVSTLKHLHSFCTLLTMLYSYVLFICVYITGVVTPSGISVGAGGAVIALSDVQDEYAEMLLKSSAVLQALVGPNISVDTTAPDTIERAAIPVEQ
jgi:hypothetical protein